MQAGQDEGDPSSPSPSASTTEFLTSELLAQSFHRAQNLLSRFDWEKEERRRELANEISDLDTRKTKEVTERRKSVQLGIKPPESTSAGATAARGHEPESLLATLTAIGAVDEFDVSDLLFMGVESADLDRDHEIFQSLLAKARQQDSTRLQKMRSSLKDFKWQQSKMIDKSVHNYRQVSGFYKLQSRLAELESQISKSKLLLSERRYALKLMSNDSTSTEDMRLKFEAETEETIRKLIATINRQKSEIDRLTKKTETINADSDNLSKQVGEILHELEKEEKLKKASSSTAAVKFSDDVVDGKDDRIDLYAIFPFLEGVPELTEDMVGATDRLREQSNDLRAALQDKVDALRTTVEEKRSEYALLLKTEEFRELERLKKHVKRLEAQRTEDAARITLLETLQQNADAIIASMNDPQAKAGFPGQGILRGGSSGGAGGKLHADSSARRSIGGRLSVVNTLRDEIASTAASNPSAPVRSQGEAHHEDAAPTTQANEEGVLSFLALHSKFQRAIDRVASSRRRHRSRKSKRQQESAAAITDSGSEDGDEGRYAEGATQASQREQSAHVLPLSLPRTIAESQWPAIDLIRDQFEAITDVFRNASAVDAALIPYSEVVVQPLHVSGRRPGGPSPARQGSPAKNTAVKAAAVSLPTTSASPAPMMESSAGGSSESCPPIAARPESMEALQVDPSQSETLEDGEEDTGSRQGRCVQTIRDIKASARTEALAVSSVPVLSTTSAAPALLSKDGTQAMRTQILEEQFEAESFQTYGLKTAIQQLLGFVSVLTHVPRIEDSRDRLAGVPPAASSLPPELSSAMPDESNGRESVSVAMLEPMIQSLVENGRAGAAAAALQAEMAEAESVEALHKQINSLITQVKDVYRQSHNIHNNYKALLREYTGDAQRYDKLKEQLFREVDGSKTLRNLNVGEQQNQLARTKLQLAELRTQLQVWKQRVQKREKSNRKLAQYFHGGHHLKRREPDEESGVIFSLDDLPLPSGQSNSAFSRYTNERYRFAVMPQRLAVFDDISSLYEKTISDLQAALETGAEDSNGEEEPRRAES